MIMSYCIQHGKAMKYQNASWNEHIHAICACVCNHTHTNKIKRPYLSSLYVCVGTHSIASYMQKQYTSSIDRCYVMTKSALTDSWATKRFTYLG